jgi:hypothetical protein
MGYPLSIFSKLTKIKRFMKNGFILFIGIVLICSEQESVFAQLPGDSSSSFGTIAGFDTIAGDLPGVVVAHTKPYLVVGDIYVPQGKTVIIDAGAVFLFKNFTGLHVTGILLARGTKDKPIIFTSENDRDYNKKSAIDPAPFDWNGLFIHEDGMSSHIAYCAVLYSVEGITSATKFIRLNTCLFLHNGRANLTIEGKQYQTADQPYDYALSAHDQSLFKVPAGLLKDPQARPRIIIRWTGITSASAGALIGIIWGSKLSASAREFKNVSAKSQSNLSQNSSESWKSARITKNKDMAMLLTGCGVAVLGAMGITWTYTF